mmetsp:Transcript_5914/g.14135  ORF Transcript_5914/g.14135 Transcript_5914/m.14135 type:complete len:369 (-) Transcript_5914:108-1214(-)
MPRDRSRGSRSRRRSKRKRSRSQRSRSRSSRSHSRDDPPPEDAYRLDLLPGRRLEPLPSFDIEVEEEESKQTAKHVLAKPGQGYLIRVSNLSSRHIACTVTVDGENALLKDGSLIVAPRENRELPGFLVSKNFIGREYVKEYRDFIFGKPKVIEDAAASKEAPPSGAEYLRYGLVSCNVYEAVLDEEVDSDKELSGQTTHYRGQGLHGEFDRKVPEGKKKHLLYSSVTVQGSRSSIANSTRGRWWVRGPRLLRTVEVRYREAHALMLMGITPAQLNLPCRMPHGAGMSNVKLEKLKDKSDMKKDEEWAKKEEADDEQDEETNAALSCAPGFVHVCDLTEDADEEGAAWSLAPAPPRAAPVDIEVTAEA